MSPTGSIPHIRSGAVTGQSDQSFDDTLIRWALKAPKRAEKGWQLAALRLTEARYRCLDTLDLTDHALSSLPDVFGQLPHLRELVLRDNDLDKLPGSMAELGDLHTLNLCACNFPKIPEIVNALRSLRVLDLQGNRIEDTSDFVPALPQLEHLNLRLNRLKEIPGFIDRLSHQCLVDVSSNEIPAAFLKEALVCNHGGARILCSEDHIASDVDNQHLVDWLTFHKNR